MSGRLRAEQLLKFQRKNSGNAFAEGADDAAVCSEVNSGYREEADRW